MKSNFKVLVAVAAVSAVFGSGLALADSSTATTTSGSPLRYRAPANLDLKIVIPAFLYFQVGSAAAIDTITFSPAAANVGNSVAVAGSAAVTVVLKGNDGAITIEAVSNGTGTGLGTGVPADGFIDLASISTVVSGDTALLAPTLSSSLTPTTTAAIAVTAGKVTNRTATWTYAYANATVPSAGTYGTSANGGRVTYTAVMP
jgi:hypothetical protein